MFKKILLATIAVVSLAGGRARANHVDRCGLRPSRPDAAAANYVLNATAESQRTAQFDRALTTRLEAQSR